MKAYRDYTGLWRISGYEEVGEFSSEQDAQTAIGLARAVSSSDQLAEYFNRKASGRGVAKREPA